MDNIDQMAAALFVKSWHRDLHDKQDDTELAKKCIAAAEHFAFVQDGGKTAAKKASDSGK